MVQEALERIRSEFLEMPGMRLTAAQVQRLCGIDHLVCEAVLTALVDSKFLVCHEGVYTRLSLDTIRHARQLKATLRPFEAAALDLEAPVAVRHRR